MSILSSAGMIYLQWLPVLLDDKVVFLFTTWEW